MYHVAESPTAIDERELRHSNQCKDGHCGIEIEMISGLEVEPKWLRIVLDRSKLWRPIDTAKEKITH